MSVTSDKVKQIIDDIEQTPIRGKSGDDVAAILTGKPRSSHYRRGFFDVSMLEQNREQMNESVEIKYYRPLSSSKRALSKPVVFVKKVIRKLLFFLLQPMADDQTRFNHYATVTMNEMFRYQEAMAKKIQALERRDAQEQGEDSYDMIDYGDFEDHFRGSRESIKNNQKVYLKYFDGQKGVLDLGCGRGEFLELCRENGIDAKGVDLYEEFVEYCQQLDLDVVTDDAIKYLEDCPDSSIGGIFAAQLVEHLSTGQVVQLCRLAMDKLRPGSCLIIETPNPMSLAIYRNWFYVDPSHHKPVHPYTMEYLLRKEGFTDIEVIFTENSRTGETLPHLVSDTVSNLDEFNAGLDKLTEIMFGSQDYAIIARKI